MSTLKTAAADRLGTLHYAVLTRVCDAIDDQLQQGADVIARNQDGDTALHMLCCPRKRKCSCNVDQWEDECSRLDKHIIRRLCSADKRCLTARDAAGNTPLMRCIKTPDAQISVVVELLEQEHDEALRGSELGTTWDSLNNYNESLLDLAFSSGRGDVIKAICEFHFKRAASTVSNTVCAIIRV